MIPDNSCAFLKKDYKSRVIGDPKSEITVPKGTPVFVRYFNEFIGRYECVTRIADIRLRFYEIAESDIETADMEYLDPDVRKVFEELSTLAGD